MQDAHTTIQRYLELVMKLTMAQNKPNQDNEEIESLQSELVAALPTIRELAVTKKKSGNS